MKIDPRRRSLIIEAAAGLAGPELAVQARFLAGQFGVSEATVRRYARAGDVPLKRRSDHGASRCGVSEDAWERLLAFIYNQQYTVERALLILSEAGIISPGQVSPATARRELKRRLGMGCRDLRKMMPSKIKPIRPQQTVHYSYECEFPNQVWEIDFTVAGQVYLNPDNTLGTMTALENRKNSRRDRGPQLWIYGVVDVFSRCVFYRAYPAMNTACILDFLYWAFQPKDRWPVCFEFCGMPFELRGDGDSRLKSRLAERLFAACPMEIVQVKANPNANAFIERQFLNIKDIQNVTRLRGLDLDEFNLLLLDAALTYNWRIHSTTHERPMERWIAGIEKVRVLPERELWDALMYNELHLYIHADLHYHVRGEQLQLPDLPPFNEMAGRWVTMKWGERTRDKVIVVWKEKEFEAPLLGRRFYPLSGDHPYVPRKNAVEAGLERAMAVDNSHLRQWGFSLEKFQRVARINSPAREVIEIAAPAEPLVSRADAITEVRRRTVGVFGMLSRAAGEYLNGTFPEDGVTRAQIEAAVEYLGEDVESVAGSA